MVESKTNRIEEVYSALGEMERARFLLGVMQELTIIGREAYENGPVERPELLRKTNEIQQHLTGFAIDVLDKQPTLTTAGMAQYLDARFSELGRPRSLERALAIAKGRIRAS